MIVCIAEKPSVARDIAQVLGATNRKDGYIEGNGYQVTWTFGHLCTLKEPQDYTDAWKSWSLGSLPMVPPRFGIKLIANDTYEKQFHVIEGLMQKADMIINCGDAGQEGELIQRWVMQKAGAKCPVKRLWISSLTEESIREGFQHLHEASDYQSLYEAGLSRAIGDWLLGMNATRLYTIKYGQNRQVLSIGRVQTPTLALIVSRQQEIENFVPKQYWELKTTYRDVLFNAVVKKSDEELIAEAEKNKKDDETIDISKIDNPGMEPIANEAEADAFIRIHANGSSDSSVKGAETICQKPDNPWNGDIYEECRALSDAVIDALAEETGCENDGVWETNSMSGINWCAVPVTIVEVGYMSNPEEDELLGQEDYQNKIALGIANGIDDFIGISR